MAAGGTVLDPEVVRHLLRASRQGETLASIFAKLGLPASTNDNRRVLATIRYLES